MDKASNPDRRTTQRKAALKPVNYLPTGTRKRVTSNADQGPHKKQKKATSSGSKSISGNREERNSHRHHAPDILSDSGNEDISSTIGQQRRTSTTAEPVKTSTKGKVVSNITTQRGIDENTDVEKSDRASDENEDEDQNEDQDDGVMDLQMLNSDALKSTFSSERPQWKDHSLKKAQRNQAHQSNRRDSDDDGSLDANENIIATSGIERHFNEDSEDDENPEDHSLSRTSKMSVIKPKPSKRGQNRRDEVPQWASNQARSVKSAAHSRRKSDLIVLSDDSDGNSADGESNSARESSRSPDHINNKGWPTEAHFTQPKQGSRIISLKDQPGPLNKTLRRAIHDATGDVLFLDAFPSIDQNYKYHRKLLRSCAREFKFNQLADRFSRDVEFGLGMARLLQQRISNLRGLFKSKGRSRVEAAFLLISNDPNTALKVEKLTQRTEYIFKPNSNGTGYDKLAPFRHPSIIAILQDVVFKGSRGSAFSEKHAARFPTLSTTDQQPKRRMISEAMVCMAATAVHAILDDWRSGREIPSDFNAELYSGVYASHIEFMMYTREGNPAGYQYMMSKIYDDCSVVAAGNLAVSNKAMELLDLHNMPVE